MTIIGRIGKREAKHLYEIETYLQGDVVLLQVDANNRDQAARIAEKAGYEVRSVNMVG